MVLSRRWCADNEHGKVSQEVRDLMRDIFKCGNYTTIKEYQDNKGITLKDIMSNPWFEEDLPEGAKTMREECIKKTQERLQSAAYQELKQNLRKAGLAVGLEQTRYSLANTALSASPNA